MPAELLRRGLERLSLPAHHDPVRTFTVSRYAADRGLVSACQPWSVGLLQSHRRIVAAARRASAGAVAFFIGSEQHAY